MSIQIVTHQGSQPIDKTENLGPKQRLKPQMAASQAYTMLLKSLARRCYLATNTESFKPVEWIRTCETSRSKWTSITLQLHSWPILLTSSPSFLILLVNRSTSYLEAESMIERLTLLLVVLNQQQKSRSHLPNLTPLSLSLLLHVVSHILGEKRRRLVDISSVVAALSPDFFDAASVSSSPIRVFLEDSVDSKATTRTSSKDAMLILSLPHITNDSKSVTAEETKSLTTAHASLKWP